MTTELVLIFHKNITKLVCLWLNVGLENIEVLDKDDMWELINGKCEN